ncbi:MAG: EAL domain-containing protein [Alphaproteobacteria bacterium]|jgi:cyclic-di-GMP phosphodiesterase TipF (flagellum assembly factor)|nr:EAL domain-containing protein [Alphaproteobacteria bacterium]
MRSLSLPLLGGCALVSGLLALGASFFAHFTNVESFTVGAICMILMIFLLDSYLRSVQQEHLSKALHQFYELQASIVQKLNRIDEHQAEHGSEEVISEIKLLQTLIHHMVEEEHKQVFSSVPTSGLHRPVILEPEESKTPSFTTISQTRQAPHNTKELDARKHTPEQLLTIIKDALSEDRIEMLMQPIVSLPQRKMRGFECYSRLRDENGDVVVPDHYIDIAEERDFMRIIDNTLLFRCVQLVRKALKKDLSVKFFCNLSLATLRDKMFLESFIEFLASNATLAPNLIFEVEYEDLVKEDPPTLAALSKLAEKGCHFSADHVPTLAGVDFDKLKRYAVQFLKVDIHLMIEALNEENPPLSLRAFQERATHHKMDVIVTKVEEEKDLLEILDYQFDYGQGYLFGKPRLNKG